MFWLPDTAIEINQRQHKDSLPMQERRVRASQLMFARNPGNELVVDPAAPLRPGRMPKT
jgi:hypothetical protein